jgi:hypothetical protein
MRLNRRQILQASLFGGLVGTFGGLSAEPRAQGARAARVAAAHRNLDGYEILRDAVRFGKRLQLGRTARADTPSDDADDTVLVTIKVMNHIHTPLCFKVGAPGAPYTGPNMVPWTARFKDPAALALLMGRGLDAPSRMDRFARLRLNGWWADLLATGNDETGRPPAALAVGDVGPFPAESDVAIQAALSVSQTDLSLNHSFKNCALPANPDAERGGDIGYHCAMQGIIKSPLGLVCLNMGSIVETTDSIGNVPNRVVANDLVRVAVLGRSVDAYTRVVAQAVGLGLVDEELVSKFDAFVKADTTLVDELKRNRTALRQSLTALGTASAMETQRHAMAGITGAANFQLIGAASDQVAQTEFLAQCKFVQQALDVPGKPFRNFTLFLNIVDLDGAPLDTSAAAPGSVAVGAQPYSYVEGMRQLAIGMNLLAQVIKKHRNVYVAVVSEGGRAAERTDDKVSHAFVMGPGGAGNMKDFLYANAQAIDSSSDEYVANPNKGDGQFRGVGQRTPSDPVVASENGATIDDHITNGALLNGLVRHLESRRGINDTTTLGLGKFVRIQTA